MTDVFAATWERNPTSNPRLAHLETAAQNAWSSPRGGMGKSERQWDAAFAALRKEDAGAVLVRGKRYDVRD